MRIYLSGPMSGYENHNYEAFHTAAKRIRDSGFDVLCPAENFNGDTSLSYDVYMRQDLVLVSICDAIAVLPGWEKSGGALCEIHAALTIGLPVFDAETMHPLLVSGRELTRGTVGFIMWRKELNDQVCRDQRQDEERENYTGILASAGVEASFGGVVRRPDSQSVGGVRNYQSIAP
jgi:hypothetical protein